MANGLLGGIGLFLLGMHMLTEGLKLAAGRALEDLLERGTSTPQRGLATGITITALVQSSSAVTVASIGFVNTGLLPLQNAVWVIFGSNVGTTLNAWLVAALGFSFRIDTFALPFVGIGSGLLLAGRSVRLRALGQALAGFGVLFLGIDVLKDAFSALGGQVDLRRFIAPGLGGTLLLVGLGTALTALMQASGAVIALVITAAESGLMPVEAACAMVIGTNIGTTFTAVLAAVSATANARRLAAAHVVFNLVTGAVALPLLPLLLGVLAIARDWFGEPATPAVLVALFHSAFNALGVLLMVPLASSLLAVVGGHFRTREEETARPRYLDDNSLAVPDLAVRALRLELGRTQAFASASLDAAASTPPDEVRLAREADALKALAPAIAGYAHQLSAAQLPPALVDALARALRTLQYQQSAAEAARQASALGSVLGAPPVPELAAHFAAFHAALDTLATSADIERPDFGVAAVDSRLAEAEETYAQLKEALLQAGAHARIDIRNMQDWLRLASLQRRATEQTAKAARMLAAMMEDGGSASGEPAHDGNDDAALAANGG
jgi:phosphate:Na+ symporter